MIRIFKRYKNKWHYFRNLNGIDAEIYIGKNSIVKAAIEEGTILKIKENSKIDHNTEIGGNLKIGKNVNIGQGCIIIGNITIGNNVTIEDYVVLDEGTKIRNNSYIREWAYINPFVIINPKCYVSSFSNINSNAEIPYNSTVYKLKYKKPAVLTIYKNLYKNRIEYIYNQEENIIPVYTAKEAYQLVGYIDARIKNITEVLNRW